jgi:uncharacterized protein (DUF362 family)
MAMTDTLRGMYHLFADRRPGNLEVRPPKSRKTALWRDNGQPLVSKVHVLDDVKVAVAKSLDLLGGLDKLVRPGDRLLVKPNFNSPDPFPASTDLIFLKAVLELLLDAGSEPIVGESAGGLWRPTRNTVAKLGVPDSLKKMGVEFVAFDDEDSEWVEVPIEGDYLHRVTVPKVAYEADRLIYLPSMKTHQYARFALSLKLSMGFVHPAERLAFHMRNLEDKLAEISLAFQPDLIIMDARKAFVSGGPSQGELAEPGMVMASGDMVAIDVEALKILKSYPARNRLKGDPYALPQVATAVRHGLTSAEDGYKVVE